MISLCLLIFLHKDNVKENIMINIYKHNDVLDLIKLVNSMKVVSMPQIKKYFANKGIEGDRLSNILTITEKSGRIFFTDTKTFAVNQKHMLEENYFNLYMNIYKIAWLYCELSSIYDEINTDCKFPCKAFLYNSKSAKTMHIFQISNNSFENDCINIETNFDIPITQKHPIDSIIILDSIDKLNEICLPDCIKVIAYSVINKLDNGNAETLFYNAKGERMKINTNG